MWIYPSLISSDSCFSGITYQTNRCLADFRHLCDLKLAQPSFIWSVTSVSIASVSMNSQLIYFPTNLCMGQWWLSHAWVIVFWYLCFPFLEIVTSVTTSVRFPSPGNFSLLSSSYQQNFRVPKCLPFESGILDSYCYFTCIGIHFNIYIYCTHSSEKNLFR